MIYETTTRPREVLESRIELWNCNTGEITFPKSKYNRWTRRHICAQDYKADWQYQCSEMLRHLEKMIAKWARWLNTWSLRPSNRSGRVQVGVRRDGKIRLRTGILYNEFTAD